MDGTDIIGSLDCHALDDKTAEIARLREIIHQLHFKVVMAQSSTQCSSGDLSNNNNHNDMMEILELREELNKERSFHQDAKQELECLKLDLLSARGSLDLWRDAEASQYTQLAQRVADSTAAYHTRVAALSMQVAQLKDIIRNNKTSSKPQADVTHMECQTEPLEHRSRHVQVKVRSVDKGVQLVTAACKEQGVQSVMEPTPTVSTREQGHDAMSQQPRQEDALDTDTGDITASATQAGGQGSAQPIHSHATTSQDSSVTSGPTQATDATVAALTKALAERRSAMVSLTNTLAQREAEISDMFTRHATAAQAHGDTRAQLRARIHTLEQEVLTLQDAWQKESDLVQQLRSNSNSNITATTAAPKTTTVTKQKAAARKNVGNNRPVHPRTPSQQPEVAQADSTNNNTAITGMQEEESFASDIGGGAGDTATTNGSQKGPDAPVKQGQSGAKRATKKQRLSLSSAVAVAGAAPKPKPAAISRRPRRAAADAAKIAVSRASAADSEDSEMEMDTNEQGNDRPLAALASAAAATTATNTTPAGRKRRRPASAASSGNFDASEASDDDDDDDAVIVVSDTSQVGKGRGRRAAAPKTGTTTTTATTTSASTTTTAKVAKGTGRKSTATATATPGGSTRKKAGKDSATGPVTSKPTTTTTTTTTTTRAPTSAASSLSGSCSAPLIASPSQTGARPVVLLSGFGSVEDPEYSTKAKNQVLTMAQRLGCKKAPDALLRPNVTHIIAPPSTRTLKTIGACLSHRWIMTAQWITESAKAGRLLPEHQYGRRYTAEPFAGKNVLISASFKNANRAAPERDSAVRKLVCEFGEGQLCRKVSDADYVLIGSESEARKYAEYLHVTPVTWDQFLALIPGGVDDNSQGDQGGDAEGMGMITAPTQQAVLADRGRVHVTFAASGQVSASSAAAPPTMGKTRRRKN